MTEKEWFASTDPAAMLGTLGESAAPRKRCLFVCSCVRRIWDLLADERSKRAVAVAEAYADGRASADELQRAERAAQDAARKAGTAGTLAARAGAATAGVAAAVSVARGVAGEVAGRVAREVAGEAAGEVAADLAAAVTGEVARLEEEKAQADLLRCIFGNPFRPRPALGAAVLSWNGGAVVRLAEATYTDQTFAALPVLSDMLEEAGATDPALLAHCRGPGPHARGCFALDLILVR
jgi:hypothetical protein